MLVGGFFDRHSAGWSDDQIAWYEGLMEEQDVDILAWAMGTQPVPERWDGEMMQRLKQVDYIRFPE